MNTVRIRRRPSPRGKTAAIVLLVLAAICGIVGLAGGYFAYKGFTDFVALGGSLVAPETPLLTSPGEVKVTGGQGVIFVSALERETIDGKDFTFPPADGTVTITAIGPSGQTINPQPQRQQASFPTMDGQNQITIASMFDANESGEYTIQATGGTAALHVKALTGKDAQAVATAGVAAGGGALGGVCGCGGALVFGLIGGILLLFGGKKTAAA